MEPKDELKWLRERIAGMTEGPWTAEVLSEDMDDIENSIAQIPEILLVETSDGDYPMLSDALGIATLRNVAAELLEVAFAIHQYDATEGQYIDYPEAMDDLRAAIRREMKRER